MTLTQLLVFLPAAALVAATPGANNLLSFSHGSRNGFLPAVIALLGRFLAFGIMIGVVVAGLGSLLETSVVAFQVVKWAGVIYLAYLGFVLLRSPVREVTTRSDTSSPTAIGGLARREFLVAMANPKAVLLFTAFVPQFIDAGRPFSPQLVALGATYVAVEFVAATAYALAGNLVRSHAPSPRRLAAVDRATGALMIGAAALLATTRRS